jgi:xanthine dehydrogenase accessory factor
MTGMEGRCAGDEGMHACGVQLLDSVQMAKIRHTTAVAVTSVDEAPAFRVNELPGTEWMQALQHAVEAGRACALATVASTRGSVPRQSGTKMLVFADGPATGTVGGGRFESLVIEDARETLRTGQILLRTYPLHEGGVDSFGAVCGGEVTVLIEPQRPSPALFIFGAGHCAQALGGLAKACGFRVTVLEDRPEYLNAFGPGDAHLVAEPARTFIDRQVFRPQDAVVLVNRNYLMDQEALHALLTHETATARLGYLGMIGSQRKVRKVYDELSRRGIPVEKLHRVHAPVGLAIGADSPMEIAVSIVAEMLAVLRSQPGKSMKLDR